MEDELLKKRVMELRKRALFGGYAVFTDFLACSEIQCAKTVTSGSSHMFYGGSQDAERVMLGIAPEGVELLPEEFPIRCMKISPKNAKFSEHLTHRDILGSVLGLGIERGVVGDIYFKDADAYVFCHEKIMPFLLEHLTQVRHTKVSCTEVSLAKETFQREFQEFVRSVAALRLDAVAAAAFNVSRNTAAADIASGRLFLNGRETLSPSVTIKEEDVISYRGIGKARLKSVGALTRKGRISVTFEKYK